MVRTPGERSTPALSRAGWLALPCLVAGGCSLALDFDKPADAPPPDAPVTTAQCMAQEPNDSPSQAMALAPGEVSAAICGSSESDYYKITVAASQRISARLVFMNRNGAGDLDLRLLTGDGAMAIDDSKTTADMEEVMCPGGTRCPAAPLAAGDYVLQVLGSTGSVEAPYTLTYTTSAL